MIHGIFRYRINSRRFKFQKWPFVISRPKYQTFHTIQVQTIILRAFALLKVPSFALLISRYILRLGQAAQKQQRPRCPNPKMYLEIRRADERLLNKNQREISNLFHEQISKLEILNHFLWLMANNTSWPIYQFLLTNVTRKTTVEIIWFS